MKTRILLVDDDPDDRDNFKDAVEVLGIDAELTCAENGWDALELISSPGFQSPQLMFLDLNMPKVNGIEVLEYIKEHKLLQDVPVIVMSTVMDPFTESRCLALGAKECMVKPMWFRPLLFQIRTVLNTYLLYYFLL